MQLQTSELYSHCCDLSQKRNICLRFCKPSAVFVLYHFPTTGNLENRTSQFVSICYRNLGIVLSRTRRNNKANKNSIIIKQVMKQQNLLFQQEDITIYKEKQTYISSECIILLSPSVVGRSIRQKHLEEQHNQQA